MTRRKPKPPWQPEQHPRTRGCDERPWPRVGDVRMDGSIFKRLAMVGVWEQDGMLFRATCWKAVT